MNKHVRPPTERYYAEAASWAQDRNDELRKSRRIAWIVAICVGVIAVFEALALMFLTPLKTVVPYTLLVDRQTGFVQALNPLTPRRVSADAALTQSLLAQYVVARETFDRATIRSDYRRVALWSTGTARAQYISSLASENPASLLRRMPAGTVVIARVKSVSPLATGTSLVRFETVQQDRSGQVGLAQPWVSIVRYRYLDAPMKFEDRLVNPLGFQVVSYRRDAEAPPPIERAVVIAPPPDMRPTAYDAVDRAPADRVHVVDAAGPAGGRVLVREQVPLGGPFSRPLVNASGSRP